MNKANETKGKEEQTTLLNTAFKFISGVVWWVGCGICILISVVRIWTLKVAFMILSVLSMVGLILLNLMWNTKFFHNSKTDNSVVSSNVTHYVAPKDAAKYFECPLPVTNPTPTERKGDIETDLAFQNLRLELGRWDNQNRYKIFDFALVGDNFVEASESNLVCLATQSSVERLHSLIQVAQNWGGPISIAVYIVGSEEFTILQYFTTFMRLCFESVRNNVIFHVAFPSNQQPEHEEHTMFKQITDRFDCKYPEHTLRRLLKMSTDKIMRYRLKNEYPQNHMRNLARKGCQSKFVFLTDVDIIPSANIVPELNHFFETAKCENRCAYVIPTFEIDVRVKFPASKAELLRLHKKGLARPFHEKVFIYNQFATNFSSWLADKSSDSKVYVSHIVTNFEFLYEPFYVSLDNVPIHDERFLGYGFTRNTQVFEMYVAGYTFYVLTPVFTCHWGLQQRKTRPAWREHQNNINRKRFETFKSEIFARYKNDPLKSANLKLLGGNRPK